MLIAASLILTPLVFAAHQFHPISIPLKTVDWIILLEIFLSSIGYIILLELIKLAGPVYYSLVGGVVALTGLFWGWLIFAEKLTVWSALSVCCILLALVLMVRFQAAYKNNPS